MSYPPQNDNLDLDAYKLERNTKLQTQQLLADQERENAELKNSWFAFLSIAYWRVI